VRGQPSLSTYLHTVSARSLRNHFVFMEPRATCEYSQILAYLLCFHQTISFTIVVSYIQLDQLAIRFLVFVPCLSVNTTFHSAYMMSKNPKQVFPDGIDVVTMNFSLIMPFRPLVFGSVEQFLSNSICKAKMVDAGS